MGRIGRRRRASVEELARGLGEGAGGVGVDAPVRDASPPTARSAARVARLQWAVRRDCFEHPRSRSGARASSTRRQRWSGRRPARRGGLRCAAWQISGGHDRPSYFGRYMRPVSMGRTLPPDSGSCMRPSSRGSDRPPEILRGAGRPGPRRRPARVAERAPPRRRVTRSDRRRRRIDDQLLRAGREQVARRIASPSRGASASTSPAAPRIAERP